MMLTRRAFLAGTVLAGGTVFAASSAWRGTAAEPQELRIPELIDVRSRGQSLALRAQAGRTAFFPGQESRTLGYNGSYLGPTLRVHRGDDVETAVTNALGEETSVHWHGLLIPGELDGGPHQMIRPGATWRPVLPIRQPAATLWYHSHVHGRTAKQVYAGLAGLLLVTDDDEKAFGLPSEYGVDDLPLILQDRQFEDGQLILPAGMMTLMHGRRGDTLLVNGTANAVARVPRRLIRLRLVNGSNARIYDLAFGDNRPFHWIASEGGLLERPIELRSLSLAPGERAEILVDFADGRSITLETGRDTNAPMMMGMRARASDLIGNGREPVLRFEPLGGEETGARVPERLVAHERLDVSRAVGRRRFAMTMGMSGMMSGMMGGAWACTASTAARTTCSGSMKRSGSRRGDLGDIGRDDGPPVPHPRRAFRGAESKRCAPGPALIRASGIPLWRRSQSSFLCGLRSLRWQRPSCTTATSSNTRTTG